MDLSVLLQNPALQAVAIKLIVDVVKKQLQNLDSSHVVDHYGKYVQGAIVGLTALVSFLTLAVQHHSSDVNVNAVVTYFMTLLTSTFVVHKTVEGAKQKLEK